MIQERFAKYQNQFLVLLLLNIFVFKTYLLDGS